MRVMRSIYKQKKKEEIILLYRRKIVKIKQTRLKLYQIYKLQGLKKSQPRLLESETMVCHSTSQQLLKNMQKQTQMPKEMNTIKSQTKHILYEYQRKRTYFSQYNNSGEAKKVQHDSYNKKWTLHFEWRPTYYYQILLCPFQIVHNNAEVQWDYPANAEEILDSITTINKRKAQSMLT